MAKVSTLRRRTANPFMTNSFRLLVQDGSGTPSRGRECSVDARHRDTGVNQGGQPHEAGGNGQGQHSQEANGKSFHDKLLSVVSTGRVGRQVGSGTPTRGRE